MNPKTPSTVLTEAAKPALVPKLRFPEFRNEVGWAECQLSEITTAIFDGTHQTPTYTDEGVPFYSVENLVSGNANKFISRADYELATKKNKPEKDDVLITRIGKIGYSQVVSWSHDFSIYVTLAVIKKDGRFNSQFLHQFIQSALYQKEIFSKSLLSAVPCKINMDSLRATRVLLASPAEQQKIAECLSSVDELIAAQARKVDALKTHKKGLMQQLFPREGETQPRLRFPELQNAGEWVLTSVGGLVERNFLFPPKDGNHGNIHPKSSDYVPNGIPFIMASDLNGGLIDIETCHFISKEQADKLQKGFANEGDVLLSHKGTVGEVAVVRKIHTPYLMLTPQVTYYRVKDRRKLSNEFLAQLFVSDTFQSNLLEVSGGGTRAYIGITEQAKLRVQLPIDITEQQRIADCLTSLDDLIVAQTRKHEALKTHKKGLMQQLFPSPVEVEA